MDLIKKMKVAIISVSKNGKTLAEKIENILKDDPTIITIDTYHKNIKNTIKEIFNQYDAIIGIMATGILIRSIKDHIKSKTTDPAIIGIDEKGKFTISLLSGHLGGANKLTQQIAEKINATPVITTATDVNNKTAIDTLANKFYWKIENTKEILKFNKAILNNQTIELEVNNKEYSYLQPYLKNKNEIKLIKTENKNIEAKIPNHILKITPKKIIIGIGARKNIPEEKVQYAIKKVCDNLKIDINRINGLATIDVKKNETGILITAEKLNLPLEIIDTNTVKNFKSDVCSKSEFVNKVIGVNGVCEPCSLISAGENSKLIYRKTAFNGVTIAVAVSE